MFLARPRPLPPQEPRKRARTARRRTAVLATASCLLAGLSAPLPWARAAAPGVPGVSGAPTPSRPVRLAPTVRGVPLAERVVALTFDDGPHPVYTPQILALLRRNAAHATFFVLGQEALRYPELLRAEWQQGNEIGLHGMRHLVLYGRSADEVEAEVREAEETVAAVTGRRPVLYRLPQGRGDRTAREVLGRHGYLIIQWSVDPRDYLRPAPQTMVETVLRQAKPGTIIIFHDGGGPRARTVEAVARILPALRAEGYTVTTVSDLLRRAHFPLPAAPGAPPHKGPHRRVAEANV